MVVSEFMSVIDFFVILKAVRNHNVTEGANPFPTGKTVPAPKGWWGTARCVVAQKVSVPGLFRGY